jgi:hypothetical protein
MPTRPRSRNRIHDIDALAVAVANPNASRKP